jgi:peptidoglycan hydrolase-like amidase
VLLEVKGPYYIFNPQNGCTDCVRPSRQTIHDPRARKRSEVGRRIPRHSPRFTSSRDQKRLQSSSTAFSTAELWPCTVWLGTINVVNDLDIEDYVRAVLSTQTGSLEPEALSALAILTRTDAYFHSTRSDQSFWHVAAGDVGYQGCALAVPDSLVEKAINSTKHLILVHPTAGKNVPFAATWTEHSAGKTAAYQALFRKEGLTPRPRCGCPACRSRATRIEVDV